MSNNFGRQSAQYALGFVASLGLTFAAYSLTVQHVASGHRWPADAVLVPILVGIALIQMVAQLWLFLHVGEEPRPRWQLMLTLFAGLVVLIVVVGSLWIMNNLNYHMDSMDSSGATDAAIIKDEGIQPHAHP